MLSRVRVESPGLSHESESSQPEKSESSTSLGTSRPHPTSSALPPGPSSRTHQHIINRGDGAGNRLRVQSLHRPPGTMEHGTRDPNTAEDPEYSTLHPRPVRSAVVSELSQNGRVSWSPARLSRSNRAAGWSHQREATIPPQPMTRGIHTKCRVPHVPKTTHFRWCHVLQGSQASPVPASTGAWNTGL